MKLLTLPPPSPQLEYVTLGECTGDRRQKPDQHTGGTSSHHVSTSTRLETLCPTTVLAGEPVQGAETQPIGTGSVAMATTSTTATSAVPGHVLSVVLGSGEPKADEPIHIASVCISRQHSRSVVASTRL